MIIRWSCAVVGVFAGWLAVLAFVMANSNGSPAALVLFPSKNLLRNLPHDVAVTSSTPFSITLATEARGLAPTLYSLGARLVLPAGLKGCVG